MSDEANATSSSGGDSTAEYSSLALAIGILVIFAVIAAYILKQRIRISNESTALYEGQPVAMSPKMPSGGGGSGGGGTADMSYYSNPAGGFDSRKGSCGGGGGGGGGQQRRQSFLGSRSPDDDCASGEGAYLYEVRAPLTPVPTPPAFLARHSDNSVLSTQSPKNVLLS